MIDRTDITDRELTWLQIFSPCLEGSAARAVPRVAHTDNLGCLLPEPQTSSSWGWKSCTPMMLPWIWGTLCFDWAMKACNYGALG